MMQKKDLAKNLRQFGLIFVALFIILVMSFLSPVFLIVALAIKLEDRGSVFYVQERMGLKGKVFRMYKFRSMCQDAEKLHKELLSRNELDGPAFKMKEDPRVTRVGRFIRRTSIDEQRSDW